MSDQQKYFIWDDISYKYSQWKLDAWRIDHPWQFMWQRIQWRYRSLLQPISHKIGINLLAWGYLHQSTDEALLIHALHLEVQSLRTKLNQSKQKQIQAEMRLIKLLN